MPRRILLLGGVVIVLAVLVGGVLWLRQRALPPVSQTQITNPVNITSTTSTSPEASPDIAAARQTQIAELQRAASSTPAERAAAQQGVFAWIERQPQVESRPTPVVEHPQAAATSSVALDSDHDGLSDADETKTYHTDPQKSDTDGDGLSDGDEVLKYGTNPLSKDTDADGYPDGTEIEKGYNPLGAGTCPKPGCLR